MKNGRACGSAGTPCYVILRRHFALIKDVAQIAKYFAWHNDEGNKKAHAIMDEIHNGKFGSSEGIWVQVGEVLKIGTGGCPHIDAGWCGVNNKSCHASLLQDDGTVACAFSL